MSLLKMLETTTIVCTELDRLGMVYSLDMMINNSAMIRLFYTRGTHTMYFHADDTKAELLKEIAETKKLLDSFDVTTRCVTQFA